MVLRGLLEYLGVDLRRIRFSWVSAGEGAKWAELVNDTVEQIRALGPYEQYRKAADYLKNGVYNG